ncbi:hypothetical protein VTO42DRAFT_1814 [Malbranchea cinnamomea]
MDTTPAGMKSPSLRGLIQDSRHHRRAPSLAAGPWRGPPCFWSGYSIVCYSRFNYKLLGKYAAGEGCIVVAPHGP